MALTYIEATVTGPSGERRTVEFLVDSGAVYTLLPHETWQALGLAPKRTVGFALADGTRIERPVSECHIEFGRVASGSSPEATRRGDDLAGHEGHTPVILGEPGDEPLLGAITLEEMGLVLNPFKRKLQAMKMYLA